MPASLALHRTNKALRGAYLFQKGTDESNDY